jgi:hypothetical protein
MRAIRARYDPYEQTRGRVEQLKSLGHSVDKVRSFLPQALSPKARVSKGRVYHHGRDIHEHARRLQEPVCRPAPQRSIWLHRN